MHLYKIFSLIGADYLRQHFQLVRILSAWEFLQVAELILYSTSMELILMN